MAKRKVFATEQDRQDNIVSLRALIEGKQTYSRFEVWLVGDTPLITHSWSEKARIAMLRTQVKAVERAGRAARDPEEDFQNSLYEIGDGVYGLPTMAVKLAIHAAAHQDKGITKTSVLSNVWLDCKMRRVRTAMAGAVCDMPLTRIYGPPPEMREDMTRVGGGMTRTATLAYRGQFFPWAVRVTGRFNPTAIPAEALAFLFDEAGRSCGLCDWRNEKKGVFGSFHLGHKDEEAGWASFAAGQGPMPTPSSYLEAAE